MNDSNLPIFIFSLPRAGSTLLQRILLSHPQIGGTAEPWLMLPFVYPTKKYGVFAEYSHSTCYDAFSDFIDYLPKKYDTYYKYLSQFILNLYREQLKQDEIYFLDKTPRYYLIIPEIEKIFPDAKFIFLFRNPLGVLASIINTWNKGRLRFHGHYIDLIEGPDRLVKGYEILKDKAISIRYEDLLVNPILVLQKIFRYLDLEFDDKIIHQFSNVQLKGRLGDGTGRYEYSSVEKSAIDKWKITLYSKRRISFAKSYLNKIGRGIIDAQGYCFDDLVSQLIELKPRKLGYLTDNFDLFVGYLLRVIEYNQLRMRIREYKQGEGSMVIHT